MMKILRKKNLKKKIWKKKIWKKKKFEKKNWKKIWNQIEKHKKLFCKKSRNSSGNVCWKYIFSRKNVAPRTEFSRKKTLSSGKLNSLTKILLEIQNQVENIYSEKKFSVEQNFLSKTQKFVEKLYLQTKYSLLKEIFFHQTILNFSSTKQKKIFFTKIFSSKVETWKSYPGDLPRPHF